MVVVLSWLGSAALYVVGLSCLYIGKEVSFFGVLVLGVGRRW